MTNKLKRIIVFSLVFIGIANVAFASSQVNMNLATESSVANSTTNTATNSTTSNATEEVSSSSVSTNTVMPKASTNTSTVVKSVNETDTSTAGFGLSEILNVLLIAVGFVLILLAVAILIRIKQ